MTTKILHIPADPERPVQVERLPSPSEALPRLQALVGGYIEAFGLGVGNGIVLCDEDAKMKSEMPAANTRGQAVTRKAGLRPDDTLLGDIVIVGDDGSTFGQPDAAVIDHVNRVLGTTIIL